ncbi:uncharacterized protein B0P05DRAFT_586290 [Gilbertella persicaria]|nr:uncharacterized protein B0P05DRAFT_586290 [Gilbertella persicaria]KAI8082635.1 hypothetical protein B0P05DRAFT_586290 [Gilbertella persicaria]
MNPTESKLFSSREKAAEDQYIRQKEAEQLKALKASMDAAAKKDNKPENK